MNTVSDDNVQKHLLSVDDYHVMANAGLFTEQPKIDLINGEILIMPPIGPAHGSVVKQINKRLVMAVADRGIVSVQDSLRLGDLSEPVPDLCVLRPAENYYANATPQASDVLLLIEVAQSSLRFDTNTKARLYAAHGIVEYWIVDLPNRQLMVCKQPEKDGYAHILTQRTPGVITPDELPDVSIDMSDLFHD